MPFFGFSEPIAAKKAKYGTTEWTLWDRFEFKNDPTLKDLVSWFKANHGLDITMVSQGVSMLWSSFIGRKKVWTICGPRGNLISGSTERGATAHEIQSFGGTCKQEAHS